MKLYVLSSYREYEDHEIYHGADAVYPSLETAKFYRDLAYKAKKQAAMDEDADTEFWVDEEKGTTRELEYSGHTFSWQIDEVEASLPRLSGVELANASTDFVNTFVNEKEESAFVDTILRSHKTLQQSVMRLFMRLVKGWACVPSGDDRNQATLDLATRIDSLEPELPFI